jgi:hypothetical protein
MKNAIRPIPRLKFSIQQVLTVVSLISLCIVIFILIFTGGKPEKALHLSMNLYQQDPIL